MYLNSRQFGFTAELERNWHVIRDEYLSLAMTSFVDWPEKGLYEAGWSVFGLRAFGIRMSTNCDRCPQTARLVEAVPGLSTAGFSRLAPGTHIRPHRGYSDDVLRCHLGLVVPPGCTMRVGNERRSWEAGKCLIFDDRTEHEVWHDGDSDRIVLLLDFAKAP